jgi:hypothetical protein
MTPARAPAARRLNDDKYRSACFTARKRLSSPLDERIGRIHRAASSRGPMIQRHRLHLQERHGLARKRGGSLRRGRVLSGLHNDARRSDPGHRQERRRRERAAELGLDPHLLPERGSRVQGGSGDGRHPQGLHLDPIPQAREYHDLFGSANLAVITSCVFINTGDVPGGIQLHLHHLLRRWPCRRRRGPQPVASSSSRLPHGSAV